MFDSEPCRGKITDIDVDEDDKNIVLHHIMYEDGDEEDLTHALCRDTHNLYIYTKIQKGEIEEWELARG